MTIKTKDGFFIRPGMKITDKYEIFEIIDVDYSDGTIITRETWAVEDDAGNESFRLGIYRYFDQYEVGNMYLYV